MIKTKLFSSLLSVGLTLSGITGCLLLLRTGTAISQPVIQLSQSTANEILNRGIQKYSRKDFQGAIADATEAIRLDPNNAYAYANRSEGLLITGKKQEALQDAEQAIQLNPKLHYGYIVRGAVKTSLGEFASAQADFNKALELNPKDGFLFYWRGQLFLKQGKYQQAINDYEQSIRLSPKIAKSAYENYSLTAKQQLNAPVADQTPPSPSVSPKTNASRPQPHRTASTTPNVYSTAKATTVLIQGQNPGSGVIISKTGTTYYVLTAKHVVATPDEYTIMAPSGKNYPLNYSQVTKLPKIDLAVIAFTSNESQTLASLGDSEAIDQGELIYISGWPAPDAAIIQPSLVTTKGELSGTSPNNADGYELLYDVSTGPGMSGGPIFDGAGQVIGIHGRGRQSSFGKSGH